MEVELTIKDKVTNPVIIQHDDLKFDGNFKDDLSIMQVDFR